MSIPSPSWVFAPINPHVSDDPWNQTAADNAEWLRRFKRDAGILTDPSLPGLPEGSQWCVTQGGTGFAPPYAFPNPKAQVAPFQDNRIPIRMCDTKVIPAESSTASKYIKGLATRAQIATVFCSRELEGGLVEFVESEVSTATCSGEATTATPFPSDRAIRTKAREILKMPNTAADDPVLLEKFKRMMKEKLGLGESPSQSETPGQAAVEAPTSSTPGMELLLPSGMDLSVSSGLDLGLADFEMNDILQEIDFDFGDLSGSNGPSFAPM